MPRWIALTAVLIALAALVAVPAGAEIVQSGTIVVDTDLINPAPQGVPVPFFSNVLVNPGFETGSLVPWTTNNWSVTGADAHTGSFSAEDIGNFWIRQDFAPIDVSLINAISFWTKQPEVAIQAVDFYYSPVDFDEFLVFPGADWTFVDVTAELRPAGALEAIRIWGYSGGGPDPDLTRIDDVLVDADVSTPVQAATWGTIKELYR